MAFKTFLRREGEYLHYVGSKWETNVSADFN